MKVVADNGSIFTEAMYHCECEVGKTFSKCDRPLHIQALEYRAATFEAMQELERAKRDAEWILELAPRLPEVWFMSQSYPLSMDGRNIVQFADKQCYFRDT